MELFLYSYLSLSLSFSRTLIAFRNYIERDDFELVPGPEVDSIDDGECDSECLRVACVLLEVHHVKHLLG